MAAPLEPREAEKVAESANDDQIPIIPEGKIEDPVEEKKGSNGLLVSLGGNLINCIIPFFMTK